MFLQVSVCPQGGRGGVRGFIRGACVVLFGGACMVLFGGRAWFYSGGVCGFIWGGVRGFIRGACMVLFGGHAWFYLGGMRGFIREACVVLFGGACVVLFGGRAWFYSGGMRGFIWGGMRGFFSFFGYNDIRSMSGRYASYWNAFLFHRRLSFILFTRGGCLHGGAYPSMHLGRHPPGDTPNPPAATAADGTHPTGMLSCSKLGFWNGDM